MNKNIKNVSNQTERLYNCSEWFFIFFFFYCKYPCAVLRQALSNVSNPWYYLRSGKIIVLDTYFMISFTISLMLLGLNWKISMCFSALWHDCGEVYIILGWETKHALILKDLFLICHIFLENSLFNYQSNSTSLTLWDLISSEPKVIPLQTNISLLNREKSLKWQY